MCCNAWTEITILAYSVILRLHGTVLFRPYRMSRVTGPSLSNVRCIVSHVTRPPSGCDTANCMFKFWGPAARYRHQFPIPMFQDVSEVFCRPCTNKQSVIGQIRPCLLTLRDIPRLYQLQTLWWYLATKEHHTLILTTNISVVFTCKWVCHTAQVSYPFGWLSGGCHTSQRSHPLVRYGSFVSQSQVHPVRSKKYSMVGLHD